MEIYLSVENCTQNDISLYAWHTCPHTEVRTWGICTFRDTSLTLIASEHIYVKARHIYFPGLPSLFMWRSGQRNYYFILLFFNIWKRERARNLPRVHLAICPFAGQTAGDICFAQ
jgi:hypothetical protein